MADSSFSLCFLMWVSLSSFSASFAFFAYCPGRFHPLPWQKNHAHAGNSHTCISLVRTSLWAQYLPLNNHFGEIKQFEVWNLVKSMDTVNSLCYWWMGLGRKRKKSCIFFTVLKNNIYYPNHCLNKINHCIYYSIIRLTAKGEEGTKISHIPPAFIYAQPPLLPKSYTRLICLL